MLSPATIHNSLFLQVLWLRGKWLLERAAEPGIKIIETGTIGYGSEGFILHRLKGSAFGVQG